MRGQWQLPFGSSRALLAHRCKCRSAPSLNCILKTCCYTESLLRGGSELVENRHCAWDSGESAGPLWECISVRSRTGCCCRLSREVLDCRTVPEQHCRWHHHRACTLQQEEGESTKALLRGQLKKLLSQSTSRETITTDRGNDGPNFIQPPHP